VRKFYGHKRMLHSFCSIEKVLYKRRSWLNLHNRVQKGNTVQQRLQKKF
jgi:hypothetical protein